MRRATGRDGAPPVLLVFQEADAVNRHQYASVRRNVGKLRSEGMSFELILPTTPHLRDAVERRLESWPFSRAW